MLIIITPLRRWRREIVAFHLKGASSLQVFEAFHTINDAFSASGDRDKVNITIAPITTDQLDDWIENNVNPNWWEYVSRRIRYSIYHMARET